MVDFTNRLIRWVQVVAIIVALILGGFLWLTKGQEIPFHKLTLTGTPVVKIGNISLRVEIAETPEARTQGLSGRDELPDSLGLLFVFPEADYHAMWMKDMYFPIDIIWISEDFRIVSVNNNVSPDTYPRTFRPKEPARYAIETNSLFLETFGVRAGQTVELPFSYFEEKP